MADKSGGQSRKRGAGRPFAPGNRANPAGRPKGSRNKLSEAFVATLAADFQEHGAQAIERVRTQEPGTYLRVIASLVPREFDLTTDTTEALGVILDRFRDAA